MDNKRSKEQLVADIMELAKKLNAKDFNSFITLTMELDGNPNGAITKNLEAGNLDAIKAILEKDTYISN